MAGLDGSLGFLPTVDYWLTRMTLHRERDPLFHSLSIVCCYSAAQGPNRRRCAAATSVAAGRRAAHRESHAAKRSPAAPPTPA